MGGNPEPPLYTSTLLLIGDSTLDNVVWVGRYENCIKYKLQTMNPGFRVVNYAADGFTSSSVVGGELPHISWSHRKTIDPFPIEANEKFCPLAEMNKLGKVDFAVLSVGGNDLRSILSSPEQIEAASEAFIKNYYYICDEILKKCPKLILMMQYRPSVLQRSYGIYQALEKLPGDAKPEEKLNRLMERLYAKIVPKARKHNLPMIDLPNSFDIRDSTLYVSQIEPSTQGGELIAKLITQVIKTHAFDRQLFYHLNKQGQFVASELDEKTPWRITIDR